MGQGPNTTWTGMGAWVRKETGTGTGGDGSRRYKGCGDGRGQD